ncbi:LamB/YcsF family protein [Photobacterium sanctipauli]|uniref:LamB/YcsF family protein n=1 Tax=Photobacterium sanctipauli TaxID=1342794 RepID=A0A2T3NBT1_9GAMM|nr:5-oxoprolinase subunit PxpA [Photobacterium sanctipauli]PSW11398.1 LamB/YcsF family protein [Photobacterium sanctipauli]
MKINCDMGESFGLWQLGCDEQVMPYLDMANIACGMHASDPVVMKRTVQLAKQHGVTIGAHPGYPDLQGFGRRQMTMSNEELAAFFIYQLGALQAICQSESATLGYVKPHGALYNAMMKDDGVFQALLSGLKQYNPDLPLVVMAVPDHARYQDLAATYGIQLWFEAFVDRAYDDDGRLTPRTAAGSSHTSLEKIEQQAVQLIEERSVTTLTGNKVAIHADTLCIHGDGPLSLPTAQLLHTRLHGL